MYSAGEKFEFSKDGQRYGCKCGSNEVTFCQPIFIGKYATVNGKFNDWSRGKQLMLFLQGLVKGHLGTKQTSLLKTR